MNQSDYFENTVGTGVLATADKNGNVDMAIYAKPHVMDEQTLAFIMRDRLSHQNVTSNPHACYMFIEKSEGYEGIRIYLTKVREEDDPEKIKSISRRSSKECSGNQDEERFLVYFQVDKVRSLIGDKIKE